MGKKTVIGNSSEILPLEQITLGNINDQLSKLLESVAKDWVEESTGFPPYWSPEYNEPIEGEENAHRTILNPGFIARVIGISSGTVEDDEGDDDSYESFDRVILSPTIIPVKCRKGPSDNATDVLVLPGEFFSMSIYKALDLDKYRGREICLQPIRKDKTSRADRKVWIWSLKVSKETKAELIKQIQQLSASTVSST